MTKIEILNRIHGINTKITLCLSDTTTKSGKEWKRLQDERSKLIQIYYFGNAI